MELEPEPTAESASPIYNAIHIRLGTFIGGPLVAGYFIAHNYKVFDDSGKVVATWIYTIAATVVIFGGAFLIPAAVNIPNYVIPIVYCWIAYYLAQHFQGSKIDAYTNSGARVFGWGRVVLIGFIGMAITLLCLYAAILIAANSNS